MGLALSTDAHLELSDSSFFGFGEFGVQVSGFLGSGLGCGSSFKAELGFIGFVGLRSLWPWSFWACDVLSLLAFDAGSQLHWYTSHLPFLLL